MKSSNSEVGGGSITREADLPELGVRVAEAFGRIVAAEARLLESNVFGAAQALLDRVYLFAILAVLASTGVLAIVASIALVLHLWMPWWQVLGLVGLGAIIVAVTVRRVLMPTGISPFQIPAARAH